MSVGPPFGHPAAPVCPRTEPAPRRHRAAVFEGHIVDTPVLGRDDLIPGESTTGPVLVQLVTTTIVVPPRWTLQITDRGSFILSKEQS